MCTDLSLMFVDVLLISTRHIQVFVIMWCSTSPIPLCKCWVISLLITYIYIPYNCLIFAICLLLGNKVFVILILLMSFLGVQWESINVDFIWWKFYWPFQYYMYIQLYERLDISSINFSNDRMYLLEGSNSCRSTKLYVLFSKTCYCSWLQSCRFYIKKHTYVLLLLAHASVERTAKRCIALHNTWIN